MITFKELHKYGVTSAQLLNWSAPINIAEQYEMDDVNSMNVFYNCSLPWFGPKCQYKFNYELSLPFDDIVRLNFFTRDKSPKVFQHSYMGTCYPFLTNCYHDSLLMCLDWREICDGKFDCDNGEDEQYCQTLEISECPLDTYRCHYGAQCIPLEFIMDGPASADCLDGTDEMELYEEKLYYSERCPTLINCAINIGLNNGLTCCPFNDVFTRCSTTGIDQSCSHPSLFHCPLSLKCISIHRLVDGVSDCYFGEDEVFPTCQLNDSRRFTCKSEPNKCLSPIALYNGKADCKNNEDEMTETQRNILHGYIPFGLLCDGINDSLLLELNETDETNCEYWPCNNPYTRCNAFRNCFNEIWYCNRGILIRFNINETKKCLCPPSYFGNRCQWQNQRISLTLQLAYRTVSYTIAVFQIIILLIDEQRQISSYYEQITYVPKRDCDTKFNLYILYPDRPKNFSTNYSIHIDIFDKILLTYVASWYLSIPFQFLPVNRIATQLFIPSISLITKSCSLYCGKHGRCVQYINKNSSYFCQCNQGYSGLQCNIKYNCSCSSDSFCLTSSICICPLNKFGSKCYLKHSICKKSNNPCQNNGLCIPIDDRKGLNQFTCLCNEHFYGTRCENMKNRIDIEFDDNKISMMSFVFIHFITAIENDNHQHTTILKKIIFDQNIITVFITHSFHVVFIELTNQTYYLGVLREKFIESEHIQTRILSNYQCLSINELMNNTFLNYSFIHRVKYYPYLCQQQKQLKCFYDNRYMCICDINHFSNCFTFNHTLSYDCHGENICENGGLCFQDNIKCPILSICACLECYYGTKCQFSTRGFVLSLDYILGYHIKPNVLFHRQPF
ncbi:unnamed protein product, partial [Rotaria sordida]